MSEGSGAPKPEAATTEIKIKAGESACVLPTKTDSAFDGKTMLLGRNDSNIAQEKAVVNVLGTLKEGDNPVLSLTEDQIKAIPGKIQELINNSVFAGIYINCLGQSGQSNEASALATVAFLDFIAKHSELHDSPKRDALITGAYQQVGKVLKAYQQSNPEGKVGFAVAVVDKDGTVKTINTGGNEVVILDENGKPKETIKPKITDEKPDIQEAKVKDGEKIILSAEGTAGKADQSKTAKEIADQLAAEKDSQGEVHAAVIAKAEKADVQPAKVNIPNTDTAQQASSGVNSGDTTGALEAIAGELRPPNLRVMDSETFAPTDLETFLKSREYQMGDEFLRKQFTEEVVKDAVKKEAGENDDKYWRRVWSEVDKRLRSSPDYSSDDWVLKVLRSEKHPDYTLLSRVIETKATKMDKTAQEKMLKDLKESFELHKPHTVLTKVRELELTDNAEGPEMDYFSDEVKMPTGERAIEATLDMMSFRLVADKCANIVDSDVLTAMSAENGTAEHKVFSGIVEGIKIKGEKATYRNMISALREKLADRSMTEEDRYTMKLIHAQFRRTFYEKVQEALVERRNVEMAPEGVRTANLKNINDAVYEMAKQIVGIDTSVEGMKKLIAEFQGFHNEKGRDKVKAWMGQKENVEYFSDHLFHMALKGGERMERGIVDPIKVRKKWTVNKREFYQGPTQMGKETVPPGGEQKLPGGKKPPGNGGIGPEPPGPDNQRGENPPGTPDRLKPAPDGKGENEPPPRDPNAPNPAPPGEGTSPPPPVNLETSFDAGAAYLTDRRFQNVGQLAEDIFAHDLARMPVPFYAKIPVLGGVMWGIRHPIKLIWQNGLARAVFEQQNLRFVSDVVDIVKIKQASDRSVPVEVTTELVNKALDQGRELKKHEPWWKKGVLRATDFLVGVTGVSQKSEQRFAKKWLNDQLNQPDKANWDPTLQRVNQRIIEEQSKLGERYANLGKKVNPNAAFTVSQANRFAIDEAAGDTRYGVPEELRGAVNQKLKSLIEIYANSPGSEQDRLTLISNVNNYLLGDFRNLLTDPKIKNELRANEMATNIVNIADKIKANWEQYRKVDEQTHKSTWDEVQINLLFGKSEWGGARGKKEMSPLLESLARRMAERQLFRGGGILAGGLALLQDAATFGGAYVAGIGISGTAFGMSSVSRMLGGVVGVGAMAGFKETGIGLSALGIKGIKGRYVKEVEQLSREKARGMTNPPDARIRKEMEAALVQKTVEAPAAAQEIEELINKPELSANEAKSLLFKLAQIDARMRLTDLSGARRMNFKVQNYIKFSAGHENDEYERLRGALINGMVKLQTHVNSPANTLVPQGQQLFTGVDISKGAVQGGQAMGLFDKYSALAEAQLRVSSNNDQVRHWLKNLGLDDAQINPLIADMNAALPANMQMGIDHDESLRAKEGTLRALTLKRGVAMFTRSVITAGLMPVAVGAAYGVVAEIPEIFTEGPAKYLADWGKVLDGHVPVDAIGTPVHPQVDLTPLQKGVLFTRGYLDQTFVLNHPTHDVNVDGLQLHLDQHLQHEKMAGGIDYVVDNRTGELFDMTNRHFSFQDVNHNGHMELVVVDDNTGAVTDGTTFFHGKVQVADGPPVIGQREDTILTRSGVHETTVDGHTVKVPDHTDWVKDNTSGKWDLVVADGPGKGHVVVNDASFDANGHMNVDPKNFDPAYIKISESAGKDNTITILRPSGVHIDNTVGHQINIPNGSEWIKDTSTGKWDLVASSDHSKVLINDASFDANGHMTAVSVDNALKLTESPGGTTVIRGPDAAAEWAKHGLNLDHREWYSYDQPGSQGNELMEHTFKKGNTVTLDMSTMNEAHQQGLVPNPINVQDSIKNHQTGFAFSIPGHVGQPIFIPDGADGAWDGKLVLDPNDTVHTVNLPDGTQMTLGQFSKLVLNQNALSKLQDGDIATELNSRQDVFNLGSNGQMGFIEAGQVVQQDGHSVLQSFATIRGSGDAQFEVPGKGTFLIDLTKEITKTTPGDKIPNINLMGTIKLITETSTPTYNLTPEPLVFPDMILFGLPMRQNIEKGKEKGQGPAPSREETPENTTPPQAPTTPTQQNTNQAIAEIPTGEKLTDQDK